MYVPYFSDCFLEAPIEHLLQVCKRTPALQDAVLVRKSVFFQSADLKEKWDELGLENVSVVVRGRKQLSCPQHWTFCIPRFQ